MVHADVLGQQRTHLCYAADVLGLGRAQGGGGRRSSCSSGGRRPEEPLQEGVEQTLLTLVTTPADMRIQGLLQAPEDRVRIHEDREDTIGGELISEHG